MSDIKQLITIIIPVYNESESIGFLLDEVINVMSLHEFNFELIVINDGSKDYTDQVLKELTFKIKELSVISLRKNYGQTAAMSAGFDNSKGDIIITLDGDLQNDPNDIPILISEINNGYDLICGWRFDRKDKLLNRKIPSKRENKLIAKVRTLNSKIDYTFQDFLLPANGIITGVFGSQRILNGKPRRPHYGIDIAAKEGSKVISPTDAIVRLSEKDLYFTGGTIMLDHGHGITSVYSHLSKVLVKKNDKIQKGDVIGLIGSTGRSTGPHLDWRINWFDQRLDPMMFIKNK